MNDFQKLLITPQSTIKQAMQQMVMASNKELFIVDEHGRLWGALSDGDIRRWILSEGGLHSAVDEVGNPNPVSVAEDYQIEQVKKIMLDLKIEAIPVVDQSRKVVRILLWDEVFREQQIKPLTRQLRLPVVIMAGGKGTRLDPFTKVLPKPLIPIGDKPIIELIIDRFYQQGVKEFYLSINHKARMIRSYFDEMPRDYQLLYIEEEHPLGTAGALGMIDRNKHQTIVVTNCDTIIEAEYASIADFHQQGNFDITVVACCKHYVIPYGVCSIENGGLLKNIDEKPGYDLLVNTGMYVINTQALSLIKQDQVYHITDLVRDAQQAGLKVAVYPLPEKSWIDIGQWEEYHRALKTLNIS